MRFARPLAVLAAIAAMAAPAGTAMASGASGGTDAWPTLIATAAGGNSGGHYGTDTTGGMSAYVPFRKAIDGFAMKDGATYTVPDATGWHTFDENGSKTEENGVTSMWSHTCAVLVGVKTAVFGGKDVTDGSLPDGWKATATWLKDGRTVTADPSVKDDTAARHADTQRVTITAADGEKRTVTFRLPSATPAGDTDKDGSYTTADLAGTRLLADGTPVDGFDPSRTGPYTVATAGTVTVDGLPDGWSYRTVAADAGLTVVVLDPDGHETIRYTLSTRSGSNGSNGSDAGTGDGAGGNGSATTPATGTGSDADGGTTTPAAGAAPDAKTDLSAAKVDTGAARRTVDANLATTGTDTALLTAVCALTALTGMTTLLLRRHAVHR